MPKSHTLDKVDRKLLNLLQKDNQIQTRVLAEKVHISQPTCLRRLRDLRDAGVEGGRGAGAGGQITNNVRPGLQVALEEIF